MLWTRRCLAVCIKSGLLNRLMFCNTLPMQCPEKQKNQSYLLINYIAWKKLWKEFVIHYILRACNNQQSYVDASMHTVNWIWHFHLFSQKWQNCPICKISSLGHFWCYLDWYLEERKKIRNKNCSFLGVKVGLKHLFLLFLQYSLI